CLLRAALPGYLVNHGHGRFCQDADGGGNQIELPLAKLFDCHDRFVFPRDEYISDSALNEGRRRAARSRIEHRHILEQLPHKFFRPGFVAPGALQFVAVSSEIVPARPTRGLRVGRDNRDARFYQIVPVLDSLWISLADEEEDGGSVGRTVVRQPPLPVGRQQLCLLSDRVDVISQRQSDDIGGEAVDDGPRLFAGAAVRLPDDDRVAGLFLPIFGEGGVEILIQLTSGVVRNVQEVDVPGEGTNQGERQRRRKSDRTFV